MLENLKILLGIPKEECGLDEKLELILEATTNRLKGLIGASEVPEALGYIVTDVAIIRFNKIGSEGLSSHTVEGESLSFSSNDFVGYMADIQAYLDGQKNATKGRMRFL